MDARLDDGALMVIVNEQIDWILGKADISRDAGKLALLSVLMHVRDLASVPADPEARVDDGRRARRAD